MEYHRAAALRKWNFIEVFIVGSTDWENEGGDACENKESSRDREIRTLREI